jgi:hypothetical protein
MTLQELLKSVEFKDIAPVIVKAYPDHEYMLCKYKMAFDILRNMKPILNPNNLDKEIKISLHRDEYEQYISVYDCEGDLWESSLAKEIIVSKELQLENQEIAAHCLWSITYFGYNPKDRDARIKSIGKFWDRTTNIKKTIRTLTSNTKNKITKEELQYLFDAERLLEFKYNSYSFKTDQRIDYLIDLITNYEYKECSESTRIILMISTSSNFPLAEEEIERLQNFFSLRLPSSANIRYYFGSDEALGMEVNILVLCSC